MSKLTSLLSVAILLAGFTSCQSKGFTGGYSETQLGENVFRVSFKGNALTSSERAADFNLLRSAEVTLKKGFRYFIIVDSESYLKSESFTTSTNPSTKPRVYGDWNHVYGSATTQARRDQNYAYSGPMTTNTIVCFKDNTVIDGLFFDAVAVSNSIKSKYKVED